MHPNELGSMLIYAIFPLKGQVFIQFMIGNQTDCSVSMDPNKQTTLQISQKKLQTITDLETI